MNLTIEQQQALDRGEAIVWMVDGRKCALVEWGAYERVKNGFYDDREWTAEEMLALAAEAAEDLDAMDEIKR